MTSDGTILVIEDQQSARESLAELLRAEGYEVHEAADGNSGMALVDQLDRQSPRESLFKLTRDVAANARDTDDRTCVRGNGS